MKFIKTITLYTLSFLISAVLTISVLLVLLKIYDYSLKSTPLPGTADGGADQPSMRTMEYYPFTGGQIQAFKRETGELAWSQYYKDFDVQSGEYGFFIDFRLEAPPAKAPNEIRIILTGGSAAQGWGGRTNADMFYQLLPNKLQNGLEMSGYNCKITVINLAMGSSHIYQNFIALNKWAHPLRPDAIISFSGHNEMAVPWDTKGDEDQLATFSGGLLRVLRYSDSPHWLKILSQYFPGIVHQTMVGSLVRLMYLENYREDWKAEYLLSRIDPNYRPMPREELQRRYKAAVASLSVDDIVDSVSTPLYVHSLESISRDFPNVPIFAVFQPLGRPLEHYNRMIQVVQQKIDREYSEKIKFLDFEGLWQQNDLRAGSFVDAVHLSNKEHELVAKYLSDDLLPFVRDRCSALGSAKAGQPSPAKQ